MLNLLSLYKSEFGETKKSLGQHFLLNKHILRLIIQEAEIKKGNNVVEIGPGCGVLTYELLQTGANIKSVEIDNTLSYFLERYLHMFENFEILNKDFLLTTVEDFSQNQKIKFIGNLPYNVATKIIEHSIDFFEKIDLMVFMVQKEVADRIISTPKNKTYSSLSVFMQYFFEIKKIKEIGGKNFWPSTKVNSTILKFTPRKRYFEDILEERDFLTFVKTVFASKRKTLKNNLKNLKNIEKIIVEYFNNDKVRAEELSLENLIGFYKYVKDRQIDF
jgi:16S rRNA (adenine1518-N6/adenine1519-N6)-dimethyltransferase